MSNDFLNSDVADHLHGNLLVERLTDCDNIRVRGDLEKEGRLHEVPKTVAKKVFLQPRYVPQISMVLVRECITGILLAWSTCSMAAPIDVLVLETVLADFAQRKDTMSPHEDGIVLVQQETATWTLETISYFSLGRDNQKCAIPSELFQSLVLRNPSKESVKSLLRPSSKWRVMLEGEEKTRPRNFLDKTAKGEAIKTIAWLSKPAYSSKGDTAFVLFHFRWSIHGAIAQYLMQRTGADWKVSCSDLVFYP